MSPRVAELEERACAMSVHVESAGRGQPLVLLHGWAMHSGLWAPFLPRLVGRYRVHAVDLPGHGYSPAIAPYTLPALVDAVAAAIDALPPATDERPVVLGWSLGGAVALEWARLHPGQVGSLVLVATTPCFVQRHDWPHAMAAATLKQFADELEVSYRLTLRRFLGLQLRGSDREREAAAALQGHLFERGEPSRTVLRDTFELVAAIDLRGDVTAIGHPALVVAGDRDALAPPAAARWLAAALPQAVLAVIPGAAHVPFLSHPDPFVAELVRFTDEH